MLIIISLLSFDILTNTWTGNLVKVVIPWPDPSGAPVAGVAKVSSFLIYYCAFNPAEHSIWIALNFNPDP
jgi:hypothetical protein